MKMKQPNRRDFLAASSAGIGIAAATALPTPAAAKLKSSLRSKAEHCIFIWLGGGMAQIDTFDPKRIGDAKKRVPGSYYPSIETAVKGVRVCEHLKMTAQVMDRVAVVRTVNHDVIDEHAAAVNRMHTGRPTSGTIVYPSVGSVISHQRGPGGENVPNYILMGYPNLTRGPGFLGAKHGYIYLLETKNGPAGLKPPPGVSTARQSRREAMLRKVRESYLAKNRGDKAVQEYAKVAENAYQLAGPDFMNAFNLKEEPKSIREAYGGEFGQRCLLARRLVQRGVRFIEIVQNQNFINGTGWDTHNQGQLKQHVLIQELDRGFATLIKDLENTKMLDKTVICISSEFGRPATFDGGGGRGHQSRTFSTVIAGGGLKLGQAIGETDELSKTVVKNPVSVADWHATIYAAMDINPAKELFDSNERPVPITDGGKSIKQLFG
jgi:hypothetical protein